VLSALECEHYLLHVQQLDIVRFERELNRDAGDGVDRHVHRRLVNQCVYM